MKRIALTIIGLLTCYSGCAHHTQQTAVLYEDPAVPTTHPLGAVSYAHYAAMQQNGEAADFVIGSGEFEPGATDLTAAGRDHILEIGARMGGTPFPVIVEPSDGGELDFRRRDMVVRILMDLGNGDAENRTILSRPYSDGMSMSSL